MDRDRLRLLLVVAVGLSLAAAGCLGGGGGGASDGGADGGGGEDGAGDGGGEGSGEDLGFFNGSADPPEEAPGTAEYRNATDGYRLLVPDAWEQVGDAPLWYVGPDPGIDAPRRNVNVVVGPADGMGLDEYVDVSVEQVRAAMDAEDVRLEAAVLGGDEATRIAFDGTFRGTELTWVQLVAVHGDRAYTVTYTFPQDEEPGHESELATALEGFAFLEAGAPSGEPGTQPTAGV